MRIETCHVVIRKTLDWQTAGHDQLVTPFIRDTAVLWDSIFSLSYTACRARIKAIAQDAHRALPRVRIVEPDGAGDLDLSRVQPEDVVLLCDDDSWYHPQTVARLEAVDRLHDSVVVWPDGVYGFFAPKQNIARVLLPRIRLRHRPLDELHAECVVKANNYALSGALLRRQPQLVKACWSHDGADRYLKRTGLPVTTIAEPLSVVNKHPSSHLVLRRIMNSVEGGQDPALVLRRLVKHFGRYGACDEKTIPAPYHWAAGLIERVCAVFRQAVQRGAASSSTMSIHSLRATDPAERQVAAESSGSNTPPARGDGPLVVAPSYPQPRPVSRDLLHRQEVIRELCVGKTFADVGGLFGTVNEMVTVAMLAGAREATMIDFQPAGNWQWPLFHERCRELGVSGYHSVVGDICNDRLVDDVGRFDVTHCSGVVYHMPNPIDVIRNLIGITRERVVLSSQVVPAQITNRAGTLTLAPGQCLLVPALDAGARSVLQEYFAKTRPAAVARGITREAEAFVTEEGHFRTGPWWWLYTADTFIRMCGLFNVRIEEAWETRLAVGVRARLDAPGN